MWRTRRMFAAQCAMVLVAWTVTARDRALTGSAVWRRRRSRMAGHPQDRAVPGAVPSPRPLPPMPVVRPALTAGCGGRGRQVSPCRRGGPRLGKCRTAANSVLRTASHVNDLTRDVPGLFAGQEGDGGGNVLGLADTADRDL